MAETKNFKVGDEWVSRMEDIITKSGMNNKEYFIKWVQEEEKRLVEEETMGFSPDLARSFSEDVKKIDDALTVINNVFVSQMKALNAKLEAERNRLELRHSKEISIMNEKQQNLHEENEKLQQESQMLQEQNKELIHQNEILVPTNEKLEKTVVDKEEIIERQKEDILRLNTDLTKHQQYKQENEKISKQLLDMERQLEQSESDIKKSNEQIEELKTRHKEVLETVKERAELEKERTTVEREKEVRSELNESIESYRNENKNLYSELDDLRREKDVLKDRFEQQIAELKVEYENKIKEIESKKG